MNGSIVFLRGDDPEEEALTVDADEGGTLEIPYDDAADLRLAYAISVHKAQGCEVPVVVARLPPLARPDADPAARLHRGHPRPPRPASWSANRRRWRSPCGRDDSGNRHSGLATRLRDG